MAWDNLVPFIEGTPAQEYRWNRDGITWVENPVFYDEMTFEHLAYKGGGAHFNSDYYGCNVKVFGSEFTKWIRAGITPGGIIQGHFTFIKRGSAFGIIKLGVI